MSSRLELCDGDDDGDGDDDDDDDDDDDGDDQMRVHIFSYLRLGKISLLSCFSLTLLNLQSVTLKRPNSTKLESTQIRTEHIFG